MWTKDDVSSHFLGSIALGLLDGVVVGFYARIVDKYQAYLESTNLEQRNKIHKDWGQIESNIVIINPTLHTSNET